MTTTDPVVEACRRFHPSPIEGRVVLLHRTGPVEVDASMVPLVDALWSAGIDTVACCSGHGYRPGNIALADGRELVIAQGFDEARKIDTLFPVDIQGRATRRAVWLAPVEPTANMVAAGEQASQMLEWQIRACWLAMMTAAMAEEG